MRSESNHFAQLLERLDEDGSAEVSELFSRAGRNNADDGRRTTELFGKIMVRLDDIDSVLAAYLSDQPAPAVAAPSVVVEEEVEEVHVTKKESELIGRFLKEVEPVQAEPAPPANEVSSSPLGWGEMEADVEKTEALEVSDEPEERPLPRVSDKTVIRCPTCSRQLEFDDLKLQDEQICPYCQATFHSNSYLLSLITDGKQYTHRGLD